MNTKVKIGIGILFLIFLGIVINSVSAEKSIEREENISGNMQVKIATVDYERWWTTVASTGTVDEADISIYEVSGPNIYLKSNAPLPANLDVRYNVVAVDGLVESNYQKMRIRYKDNGNSARVIVRLKETNITSGNTYTRMTFDSNSYPQLSSYQTRTIEYYGSWWGFDFMNNIYFVETSINKTSIYGTPVLVGIQIE